jgi:hypothetical protein
MKEAKSDVHQDEKVDLMLKWMALPSSREHATWAALRRLRTVIGQKNSGWHWAKD